MKVTATKYEDVEVNISEEQIEILMCHLLKEDYEGQKDILDVEFPELLEAMSIVMKPILVNQ